MSVPGSTELSALLRTMRPRLFPQAYVFAAVATTHAVPPSCLGIFREEEGTTLIVTLEDAQRLGLPVEPAWARITLTVSSSLLAVGFLARIATALAERGISVNPVAAYHHDHLFVLWNERERALAVLHSVSATVVDTARLRLRHLGEGDADFIVRLLNDPAFLQNIGDRKVRTRDEAVAYIRRGPMASYETHGFGLYLIEDKQSGTPTGICGLLRRDTLPDVDIGFALLPEFRGRGYALEAAAGVVQEAVAHGLTRLVAIAMPSNAPSLQVLERIGMHYERRVQLSAGDDELALYSMTLDAGSRAGSGAGGGR